MKLWQKIFIGIFLGALTGALIGKEQLEFIKPIGDIFINLIKMIVVPLLFFSIGSAITSMEKSHSLGRIGGKSVFMYVASTFVAILIGFAFINLFDPAAGASLNDFAGQIGESKEVKEFSFSATIVEMFPSNPIKAMSDGNAMQIIIFAFFFGTAVNLAGKKVQKVADTLEMMAEVTYSLTGIIMKFAPYGVFALIAWVVGTQEVSVLLALLKLVIVVIAASVIHTIVVFSTFVGGIAKLNPITFFRKIIDVQLFAFSTSSSSATLPVTMRAAEEKLGVSPGSANFVLPLGSTINMNGTALYVAMCSVFIANLAGVDLSFFDYCIIAFTTTMVAIGSAGVPGVSLVLMTTVFSAVGLPIEAIAIIAGVDRLLDMFRTTVNVTGDLAVAVLIDKSEGSLNEEIYNTPSKDLKTNEELSS